MTIAGANRRANQAGGSGIVVVSIARGTVSYLVCNSNLPREPLGSTTSAVIHWHGIDSVAFRPQWDHNSELHHVPQYN